jgi:hypothetical protein
MLIVLNNLMCSILGLHLVVFYWEAVETLKIRASLPKLCHWDLFQRLYWLSGPCLSFPFLSFPFLSFPFLSFPFLSFSFLLFWFFFKIIFIFSFLRYFLYLHFKCYLESSLYPPSALFPYPPTPTSWPWHSPVLGHIKFVRLRGLSSQWWPSRPSYARYAARYTSSGGYWLVHTVVLPIGLQTPSAPWVLSLALPMGAMCSII